MKVPALKHPILIFFFPYIISHWNVKPKCFYWFKSHLAAFEEIFRILWVCFWSKPVVKLRFSLKEVSHPVNSSSRVLPKRVPRTQDCEPGILIKLWHYCSLRPQHIQAVHQLLNFSLCRTGIFPSSSRVSVRKVLHRLRAEFPGRGPQESLVPGLLLCIFTSGTTHMEQQHNRILSVQEQAVLCVPSCPCCCLQGRVVLDRPRVCSPPKFPPPLLTHSGNKFDFGFN